MQQLWLKKFNQELSALHLEAAKSVMNSQQMNNVASSSVVVVVVVHVHG
jgi:hypothetical protein